MTIGTLIFCTAVTCKTFWKEFNSYEECVENAIKVELTLKEIPEITGVKWVCVIQGEKVEWGV